MKITLKYFTFLFISIFATSCIYKNVGENPSPISNAKDTTAIGIPSTPVVVDPNLNNTGACNTNNITYFENIKIIMAANCVVCHNGTSGSAGVDLASYQGVVNASSKLYGSITHAKGFIAMPSTSDFIPDCSILQIKAWLDAGKPQGTVSSTPTDPASNAKICSPDSVYFTNTILPIYASNCASAGCHNTISHREGITLVDYKSIMTGILAKKPNSSTFYTILFKTGVKQMPPAGQLSVENKKLIFDWISQGAKNNVCK